MHAVRIVLALVVLAALLGVMGSCKTLALGGAKKYRVDITNISNQIGEEIGSDGAPSDKSVEKLRSILDTYRGEFGKFGTFTKAEEILKLIDDAKTDPGNAFNKYREAKTNIDYIVDMIRTEVPD